MNIRCHFLALVLLFALVSCGDQKIDTTAARKEMEAREIKVIPEAKILSRALELGDSLINTMMIDSVQSVYSQRKEWDIDGSKIVLSAYSLTGINTFEEIESKVYQAYEYAAKNGVEADANIQKLSEQSLLYNAPIMDDGKIVGMWSLHLPRKHIVLSIDN